MRRFAPPLSALVASALLLARPAAAEEARASAPDAAASEDDFVAALTKETFDETLKKSDRVLVEFYAPWCGHCKALEPEYKRAAKQLREEKLQTVLAKVDATIEADLAQAHEVSSYPTLIYMAKGQSPKTYDGGRTADALVEWLRKRELGVATVLEEEKVEEFMKSAHLGEVALVARVVKKSARAKAFHAAAEALSEMTEVKAKLGVVYLPKSADSKADASLRMLRPGFEAPDEERIVYDGKWTEGAIAKWGKTSSFPIVGFHFEALLHSPETAEKFGKEGVVVVLMDPAEPFEGSDKEQNEERKVKAFRDRLREELVPLAKAEPSWIFTTANKLDVSPGKIESFGPAAVQESVAVVLKGSKKYVLAGGASAITAPGAIKAHLDAVKASKATPYYKSTMPPDPPFEDHVRVLVGDTFDQYVMDPKKDVFVEFYAPWCGHCKELAPHWSALAKKAKESGWEDKGVIIAKMDSTVNECDEEVTGYPKLVLYPAVKAEKKFKQRAVYPGQRELENLIDFLLENANNLEGVEEDVGAKATKKYSMVDRELDRKKKGRGRRQAAGGEL